MMQSWWDRFVLVLSALVVVVTALAFGFLVGGQAYAADPSGPSQPQVPPSKRFRTEAPAETSVGTLRMPGISETYLGGMLGMNWGSTRDIDVNGTPSAGPPLAPGTKSSDLDLKNALVLGAKVGHYFGSLPWLGIEGELYHSNPHIKQQFVTRTEPGQPLVSGDSPGFTMTVVTVAMNLMARYPGERFQPYAGLGLALSKAHRKDGATGDSQSSTQPGLNALLGVRYKVDQHIGLFTEYKFNHTRFKFDETPVNFGNDMTYNAHMLVFGVSFSFPH